MVRTMMTADHAAAPKLAEVLRALGFTVELLAEEIRVGKKARVPRLNAGAPRPDTTHVSVIDADGVVGQVTRVFPYMAEVTLVTDKDHAVPVKVDHEDAPARNARHSGCR